MVAGVGPAGQVEVGLPELKPTRTDHDGVAAEQGVALDVVRAHGPAHGGVAPVVPVSPRRRGQLGQRLPAGRAACFDARAVQCSNVGEQRALVGGAAPERAADVAVRDSQRVQGLGHRMRDDGVCGDLDKGGVAVFGRRLYSRREPDGVAQVGRPVGAVTQRFRARVGQRGGVDRDRGDVRAEPVRRRDQPVQQGIHVPRVEGDIGGNPADDQLLGFPGAGCRLDGIDVACDHGRRRRSRDRGDDVVAFTEPCAHLVEGQVDHGHRALAGHLTEQNRPTADQPRAVAEGQRTGDHGCGDLTDRVADHCGGFEAVLTPHVGERYLHREDHWLDDVDRGEFVADEHCTRSEPDLRREYLADPVDRPPERRFRGQEIASHAHPL